MCLANERGAQKELCSESLPAYMAVVILVATVFDAELMLGRNA